MGLRANFREISKQGLRPFIVVALSESRIACLMPAWWLVPACTLFSGRNA